MNCEQVQRDLSAWLDDELDELRRLELERHLAGCSSCQRRADLLRTSRDALMAIGPEPAPPQFEDLLRHRLQATHLGVERERPRRARWARLLAAALGAIAIILLIAYPDSRDSTPDDTVTASLDTYRIAARIDLSTQPDMRPGMTAGIQAPCSSVDECGDRDGVAHVLTAAAR